jgi:RNA polymerase sigma-70 factor (ECF subfamily)
VLQETWFEAWRAMASYEHRSTAAMTAWLCRIAETSIAALADRRSARKRTAPGADLGPDLLARWADTATGVVTGASRGEESLRLERALVSLPDDERQVLLLRFLQGSTLEEISTLTGDSMTTVRRRLGRAAASLGALLGIASST